jgi:hypothetical protein
MPSPLPKSISNYIVQIGTVHNDRQLLAIHAGPQCPAMLAG